MFVTVSISQTTDTLVARLSVIEKDAPGGHHNMVHIVFPSVPGCVSESWCYETPELEWESYEKQADGRLVLRHKYDGGTVVTEVIPYRNKVEFIAHVENQTKEPPLPNMCWQLRESPTFKAIDEDLYTELVDREFIFIRGKGRVFLNHTVRRRKVGTDSTEWFNKPYPWVQIYKSDRNPDGDEDCTDWSNCSTDRYEIPVIGAVSRDGKWLVALAADSSALTLCNAWHDCMHIWPGWENGIWRNVIYAMENDTAKLLKAWREDFGKK